MADLPTLSAAMVSPTSGDEYGVLEGVVPSGSSLTAAWDSDTRSQGTLVVLGDGWEQGTRVRLRLSGGGWPDRTLGTWYVTDAPMTYSHGARRWRLGLESTLKALSLGRLTQRWTFAAGTTVLQCVGSLLDSAQVAGGARDLAGAADSRISEVQQCEAGTPWTTALFALCKLADDRLDVAPDGSVTVRRRPAPSAMTPAATIDLTSADCRAVDGVEMSTSWLTMQSQAVATYRWSGSEDKDADGKATEHELVAVASVESGSWLRGSSRGYEVAEAYGVTELEPRTQARLQEVAEADLARNRHEHPEWRLTTTYLPLWEGDCVDLVLPWDGRYGGTRRCLVRSLDLDLDTFQCRLTLRDYTGDDEDGGGA